MSEQLLDFLLYGLPSLFLWHYADGDVHIAGSITASKQLGRANYFHFNEAVKFLFCPILFVCFFLSFCLCFLFFLLFWGDLFVLWSSSLTFFSSSVFQLPVVLPQTTAGVCMTPVDE